MSAAVIPRADVRRATPVLRVNFAWTSAGNAVQSACQWASMSVLAKLGTPAIVGDYALGVAVATPILMLAQLNLRSVLATDVAGQSEFRDYRDLRFAGLLIGLAAVFLVSWLTQPEASHGVTMLVALALAADWISDIYHGLMQRHERMDRIAVSLIARGILALTAMAAGLAMTGSLTITLLAITAVRLGVLMFWDASAGQRGLTSNLPARRSWRERIHAQAGLFRVAFPLGVVLMLGALIGNTPRYIIAKELGAEAVGAFSVVAMLVQAGNLFVNALGQAATPRLAKLYASGDQNAFLRLCVRLLGLCAGIGMAGIVGATLFGRWVLEIAYTADYARHTSLLTAMMAAGAVGYVASILGYAITAARRFKEQVPLLVCSTAASTALAYWLVPKIGLPGAAVAVAGGSLAQAMGELFVLRAALRGRRTGGAHA